MKISLLIWCSFINSIWMTWKKYTKAIWNEKEWIQTSVSAWNCSLILKAICSLLSQCLFRSFTSIGSMPFHTISTDSSSDGTQQTKFRTESSQQTNQLQTHRPDSSPADVFDPELTPRPSSLVSLLWYKRRPKTAVSIVVLIWCNQKIRDGWEKKKCSKPNR